MNNNSISKEFTRWTTANCDGDNYMVQSIEICKSEEGCYCLDNKAFGDSIQGYDCKILKTRSETCDSGKQQIVTQYYVLDGIHIIMIHFRVRVMKQQEISMSKITME